jgi:hypothetical protein
MCGFKLLWMMSSLNFAQIATKIIHKIAFTIKYNDQQIFIISHGEISRSCWAPFVVEARIEPSTFRPVVQRFTH